MPTSTEQNSGTVFAVVSLPQPWPPAEQIPLMRSPYQGGFYALTAGPDGRLGLHVSAAQADEELNASSGLLHVTSAGFVILTVTWVHGNAEFFINGQVIPSDSATPFVVSQKQHPAGEQPSWAAPSAKQACQRWVAQRQSGRLAIPRTPKSGRLAKSLQAQQQELRTAARTLRDLASLVAQGHLHLAGHLATELRALLSQGKNSNPLLLRIAARLGRPLPIYVVRTDQALPVTDGLQLHFDAGMPAIVPSFPTHTIVDLEEWLRSTVVSLASPATDAMKAVTPMDLISGVADTLGSAHYDEDVPESLEVLRNTFQLNVDTVTSVLLLAAGVVIPLAEWLADTRAAAI